MVDGPALVSEAETTGTASGADDEAAEMTEDDAISTGVLLL